MHHMQPLNKTFEPLSVSSKLDSFLQGADEELLSCLVLFIQAPQALQQGVSTWSTPALSREVESGHLPSNQSENVFFETPPLNK